LTQYLAASSAASHCCWWVGPKIRLALQLQTEFNEERGCSLKVFDNDADVVHPLDRHVLERRTAAGAPRPQQRLGLH
jgi:hypothetical protein